MAPKKPSTKSSSAPAPSKANTKAKVTKPQVTKKTGKAAPAANKPKVAKTAPAKKAAPKKAAATKAAPKKETAAKKAAPKKSAPAPKKASTSEDEEPAKKRKRSTCNEDEAGDTAAPAPPKKIKVTPKGPVINQPPDQRLNVYVFGEGTAGELGLGTSKKAIDVKRPRLNHNLDAETVGVVQVVAGGMHAVALTHDNKILTWGVNDSGALGRDTTWDGGLKDMDAAEDSDDEADDNGLNPRECVPAEVDFSSSDLPEGTRFTQVAAGDSISLALTDDGHVYGWGTFRGNEGIFGFDATTETAFRPKLIPDLKKITSIRTGANHALALNTNGTVVAWGSGQQNQLGRRVVERTKKEGLKPREFGLPKGATRGITAIETGGYHSFAIAKNGDVYSWGLNNFGETGIMQGAGEDGAVVSRPQIVESLQGKTIVSIQGGGHHSLAATSDGDCLIWGRIDGHQIGLTRDQLDKLDEDDVVKDEKDEARILKIPTKLDAIEGGVTRVASCSDHNIVITQPGRAWSWGFSANYQTGQGTTDDVIVPTHIDNTAVREITLVGATTGGQFSILTGVPK